jgi:hypothetical protein
MIQITMECVHIIPPHCHLDWFGGQLRVQEGLDNQSSTLELEGFAEQGLRMSILFVTDSDAVSWWVERSASK